MTCDHLEQDLELIGFYFSCNKAEPIFKCNICKEMCRLMFIVIRSPIWSYKGKLPTNHSDDYYKLFDESENIYNG